ncbi:MAG: hypothetical protein HC805_08770 [Alkalinema sp. RL_2_19]|nr:hypothetical protein [Alkalinema sp. RL_2_19]
MTMGKPNWLPNIALPSFPSGSTTTAQSSEGCRDLEGRSTRVGISYANLNKQVNDQFYQRYPKMRGRALTESAEDQPLRNAWCDIADGILTKAER